YAQPVVAPVFPVVAPALTFQYYAQPVVAPVFPVVAPALTFQYYAQPVVAPVFTLAKTYLRYTYFHVYKICFCSTAVLCPDNKCGSKM
ncbi:hypothetical protein, partial [Nostoc sp.]|uniref:hypothetical protein n=1 Tax=Nostoc sp. TaxID=1180 RepID=UPI002FF987A8